MDVFSLFTLCGGLAFFLYGMIVMSAGLEKIAGGKMERLRDERLRGNGLHEISVSFGSQEIPV